MITRSIGLHTGLLVIAAGFAWRVTTRDQTALPEGGAEIWGGKAEQVERLELENERRRVTVEYKSDERGRFAVGAVEREVDAPSPKNPHAEGDAGAPAPAAIAERETVRFILVKDATEYAEKVAPLRAARDLGKLDAARLADYGLDGDKLTKIKIRVGGIDHEILVGSATPGGSDVYAVTADREHAFVIPGTILHELEAAESRMMERVLHGFEADEATRVVVRANETSRELVRSTESNAFWTDPGTPAGKDETASNWMKNFERLRVTSYVEAPGEVKSLFRAEYFDKQGKALGYVEFGSRVEPGKEKPQYLVRSEHTRWWGGVLASNAEPVAQDLASVVK